MKWTELVCLLRYWGFLVSGVNRGIDESQYSPTIPIVYLFLIDIKINYWASFLPFLGSLWWTKASSILLCLMDHLLVYSRWILRQKSLGIRSFKELLIFLHADFQFSCLVFLELSALGSLFVFLKISINMYCSLSMSFFLLWFSD